MRSGVLLAALIATAPWAAAAELRPFTATYTVTWHGMSAGTSELKLERLADGAWQYSSRNRPRGIFRIALPPELTQRTRFELHENRVRPLHFQMDDGSEGGKRSADVKFDWAAGRATGRSGNKPVDLPLTPGLQDAMSIQISLMHALLEGRAPERFTMIDGNRVKEYVYTREGNEALNTAVGSHQTQIFRSARPGSTHGTWFWCAADLNFLPARVERRDGTNVEWSMTLQQVQLD